MKSEKEHIRALIVIPAFNEAQRIGDLLLQLQRFKEDLLVIDDGSADGTARLVAGLGFRCISQKVNLGLTAAYAAAEKFAEAHHYTHILALDADGQHDPLYIPAFLGTMTLFELVSGNRFHEPDLLPYPKIASNLFAILLFREVLGKILPDVSCGYRGWKTGLFFQETGQADQPSDAQRFGVIYEMLLSHILGGKNAGFVNIPCIYHQNTPMNTKIMEIIGLLSMILKYKKSDVVQAVKDDVLNKRNFGINLSGFKFNARLVSGDAFVFETDTKRARQFLKSISKQTGE